MRDSLDLDYILKTGSALVTEAGAQSLEYFKKYQFPLHSKFQNSNKDISIKEDKSPVTQADLNIEGYLRSRLIELFPDFGIIGEEFGTSDTKSAYTWIIDPIDGTRSFISGVPLYTTLLGLIETDTHRPIAGFVYAPVTKELVSAALGKGCFYNGNKSTVAPITQIEDATLVSYDWNKVYSLSPSVQTLCKKANIVRTWGDGFAYIMLATGRSHIVIDPHMHTWDILPVYPIILEAGGIVSNWDATQIDFFSNDSNVIASSSQKLLELIQKNI